MQARDSQACDAADALGRALQLALHGGEDYELLFSAPASVRIPRSVAGVRVTRIGTLTRVKVISLLDSSGRRSPLTPGGWEHFTGRHED
jgi:thiamine-monophosphate kinase